MSGEAPDVTGWHIHQSKIKRQQQQQKHMNIEFCKTFIEQISNRSNCIRFHGSASK